MGLLLAAGAATLIIGIDIVAIDFERTTGNTSQTGSDASAGDDGAVSCRAGNRATEEARISMVNMLHCI